MSRLKKSLLTARDLTKYVVFSISFVVFYSIVEFVVSTVTGVSHETLTTCVYGFFAGEVVMAGLIKIFKLKTEVCGNDD